MHGMLERNVRDRTILFVGSFGPLGHLPASGTVTVALLGLPLFWMSSRWAPWIIPAAALIVCALAIWIHHVGDQILNEKDSRKLVWDEIAGFMIAISYLPFTWKTATVAFVVERIIDITKVPPARRIERTWPGGWGVVGDDVIAGLYTCAIMHTLVRVVPRWFGV